MGCSPSTLCSGAAATAALQPLRPPAPPDALAAIRETGPVKKDFALGELLGKGSFGDVYRAISRRNGELVAVKLMDRSKIKATSIAREYNVLEHLGHHPYVVGYRGTYKTRETVAFVLEIMEGAPARLPPRILEAR
jgi:serine/threonine protein kinase